MCKLQPIEVTIVIDTVQFTFQALRHTRKDKTKSSEITFQMGWLHFNPKRREYVQVIAIKGGGSPTLRLRREATKEEVIMMGKNTFFPNGHSKMGALKDMIIELADFRAKLILEEGWTLDIGQQFCHRSETTTLLTYKVEGTLL